MLNAPRGQNRTHLFGGLHGSGPDEHWTTIGGQTCNRVGDLEPFFRPRDAYDRTKVFSPRRPMQWNAYNIEIIDRADLPRDLTRRPGHAGEVDITPKQALVSQARESLASQCRLAIFLHFDKLMQSPLPGTIGHYAPGGLIDDLYLAVADNIVLIALV